jgi:hypothetical protein
VLSFNNRRSKGSPSKPAIKTTTGKKKEGFLARKFDDALFKFACLTASFIMTSLLLNSIIGREPAAQVGDMLEFYPNTVSVTAPVTAVSARIVAGSWASPGRTCTLDVSVMKKPGGAVTVMAVRSDGVMLSWAGGATASSQADCRANEQVLVTNADYERLQMARTPRAMRSSG